MSTQITFSLTDSTGAAVTEWEPGMEYILEVSSYAAAANAWIHATTGTLAPDDGYTLAACGEAVYSSTPVPAHTATWTAPAEAGCVTVSTAQASGATEGYNTNMVRCCHPSPSVAGP